MGNADLQHHIDSEYRWGFITDIAQETVPAGLSEEVIRTISAKKQGVIGG